jgi:peptide deformylase
VSEPIETGGVARPVTVFGTPVLHRPCAPVTEFGTRLRDLVADMFASMAAAEGVGLAANQIGVDARVFVYDCPDADGVRHAGYVVNPGLEVTGTTRSAFARSGTVVEDVEGCLSIPTQYATLARPARARVTGFDVRGRPVAVSGTGTLARCLQHEYDHLDGIVFVDRLNEGDRREVLTAHERLAASGGLPAWSAGAAGDRHL